MITRKGHISKKKEEQRGPMAKIHLARFRDSLGDNSKVNDNFRTPGHLQGYQKHRSFHLDFLPFDVSL